MGDPVDPMGSWSCQPERLKFPPGATLVWRVPLLLPPSLPLLLLPLLLPPPSLPLLLLPLVPLLLAPLPLPLLLLPLLLPTPLPPVVPLLLVPPPLPLTPLLEVEPPELVLVPASVTPLLASSPRHGAAPDQGSVASACDGDPRPEGGAGGSHSVFTMLSFLEWADAARSGGNRVQTGDGCPVSPSNDHASRQSWLGISHGRRGVGRPTYARRGSFAAAPSLAQGGPRDGGRLGGQELRGQKLRKLRVPGRGRRGPPPPTSTELAAPPRHPGRSR